MNTTRTTFDKTDPRVHVSSLGEFEYCPRAGVLAFEGQGSEKVDDEPNPFPDLSYSPSFDIEIVRSEIVAKAEQVGPILMIALGIVFLMLLVVPFLGLFWTGPLWLALGPVLYILMVKWHQLAMLKSELKRYQSANEARLADGPRAKIEVDWWQLVKAYQVIVPGASHINRELELEGKPWRLLSFHLQRIPVIRSFSKTEGLKSAHLMKLGAYSDLLVKEEGADCDWGVVIFNETKTGFAVPIGFHDREHMLEKLREFRKVLGLVNRGVEPAKGHPNACASCPMGKPRPYRRGKSETKIGLRTIAPYLPRGIYTHSDCGDRFNWSPPYIGNPTEN